MKMSKSRPTSVSVVIPNYNGKYLLESNIPSIYTALEFAQLKYEIIVIDDASADDSISFIQQQYPEIKLLKNEVNKGFSPTINKGIFAAQYELVLALNSDVTLTKEYFVEQLKYFEAPDTFGVMGHIVDHNSPKIQDSGKFPSVSFNGIKTTYNYIPETDVKDIWLPSFFISGANALMDRGKLMQLKGFDEIYAPYYYEDADLGIRAWRAGWCCYVEPKAICMHATSSTISKVKSDKVKIIAERNRIILNHLHLPNHLLRLFKYKLVLRCAFKMLSGNLIAYKAIKLVNNNLPTLKQSQQALQQLQTKNKVNYSIIDIEEKIIKKIRGIKYTIF
jgi:GT2 family glycosyltransferase